MWEAYMDFCEAIYKPIIDRIPWGGPIGFLLHMSIVMFVSFFLVPSLGLLAVSFAVTAVLMGIGVMPSG